MAPPRPESLKLIQYLLKTMPEAVEARSDCQYTPLSLAFSLRRFDAARILIEAGANQTVRDHEGDNILHLLLSSTSKLHSSSAHAEHIKTFLDLVDQRLIPSLLIERSAASPGSLTPLACWLRQASYSESKESEDMLRMLLGYASSYGNNEHLEMLDGSGETPVHTVVKNNQRVWLKVMLEFRPDLLYRENSVGRTPYELVQDSYIAASVSSPPYITTYNSVSSIVNRDAASFVKDKEGDEHGHTESTWRICDNFMKEHPGKRRLVSLMDANEVAKRLANRHGHKAHQKRADEESNASSVAGDADEGSDEVNQWYWSSARS
jgi:ankyrin repeat protein